MKEVTLRELVTQMAHLGDEETFRWFQDSTIHSTSGVPQATVLYRVTMGQVRRELGIVSE